MQPVGRTFGVLAAKVRSMGWVPDSVWGCTAMDVTISRLRCAIPSGALVTLLLVLAAAAPTATAADNAWTATLTVSGKLDAGQADVSRVLSFGIDTVTTSDFDDGFDVASPPAAPSPNPTIYLLNTAHTNTRLQQPTSDFRAFEPADAEEQVWSLFVNNLAPVDWTITWDISAVTTFWQTARIVSASAGVDLDMTSASSTTIATGDAHTYTITIREDGVPASVDIAVAAVEDTDATVTLTSEDPTVDTYTVLTQPTNGTLTGTAPDLTYTPDADYAGDDSFTYQADDGILQDSATVTITVSEVNDDPTADAITDPAAVAEDSGVSSAITVAGLGAGGGVDETAGGAVQTLTLSAASGNTDLIADNDLTFSTTTWTTGDADPTITFTPTADISGTALITITVTDDGTTDAVADPLAVTTTFTVTVTDVNDAPVISAISDPSAVAEDSGASAAITIAGLGMGGATDETAAQTVGISAASSDQAVVADADLTLSAVSWSDGDADPTVTFTPAADAVGTAVVTITVTDDGTTDGSADVLTATTTFTVTVTEVNDDPTIGAMTDPAAVEEDSGTSAAITISGLGAGGGADEAAAQTVALTASSSDQAVVADGDLTLSAASWGDGDADPTITFAPAADATGTAVITITATDDGTTDTVSDVLAATTTFTVTVSSLNDPPTFDAIADVSVAEDAAEQTVSITTVSPGASADESGQTVTFTATSSDQAVVADGDIALSGSGATR
ncbi:MAG: Ig-like domain-containing protein, partial [Candidatus Poribacteria bacterium]